MANFDVFNGDADGICALTQLRLAEPRETTLITGVKRDINLLKRVDANSGDQVTVLDISMDKNHADLTRLLAAGTDVFYVDHHFPGEIPESPKLTTIINEAPDVCTSLLVNTHLKGAHTAWAVVGAYGDNLNKSAQGLAKNTGLNEAQLEQLKNLGIYINYNGYGSDLDDLHFKPDELYQLVSTYTNPLDFIRDSREHFEKLENGYHSDMSSAKNIEPVKTTAQTAIFTLPDQPWAKRVSGVFSNDLTNDHPNRAHAVLTEKSNGSYLVSVRAPLNNKKGAADLCRKFPTGGGREAAAGINDLPAHLLNSFIKAFEESYNPPG
ncbi:MAG: DHH family phosphoesterase [Porticoccus sp.]|nr:DHH family phosphoesterase [Porticoccus sp.]